MGTTQLEPVPEPKYWQLKTVLSEALDSEFEVGEILPNERDLAARFGVARATLRQALEQLELEGRLQRRRGVGTTVAPPRVGVSLGTGPHIWPGGPDDVWQPVDCTTAVPSAAVAEALGTGRDESVHIVRRSRVSHGRPVAAELLHVPHSSVPGLSAIDASSGPARARAVLRDLRRLELERQENAVELGSAGTADAKELDRLPGAPVLVVTTRFVAAGGTAALSVATYRADTCRLTFGDSGGVEIHDGVQRKAS
ncbi:GntR family transcriptional regulator [Streptomyces djakartensis]|uniref:GntR family transcriptional regulator n=1 Tax=Streptomyces djakartensis TaxID=68193 RepID=A0ABQ3A0P6_9ACTN|nr:GntR family transcriptional regulator [Streptomyces djakartensis]GGY31428.1 GntR family transcriptional regulator [Streptomyces djakartensis]